MVRFLRFSKTLVLAAALGTGFALAAPQAASAGHDHRGGFWLPLPPLPPPPPFFFPRAVVHRHGPYCGHYDRYDRWERRHDHRYDRWERRHDRHERHERHERW